MSVPAGEAGALVERDGLLSAPARKLLEAVAIVPGQVDLWLLEVLAGELVDRLDECLASGC